MFNTLLFIHFIVAILLVIVILLQKTGTDGISGISGGSNNMGLVSSRTAANFLTKTTIVLAAIFMVNALVIANISTRGRDNITKKIEQQQEQEKTKEQETLPVVK